jgi:hypothetical protein
MGTRHGQEFDASARVNTSAVPASAMRRELADVIDFEFTSCLLHKFCPPFHDMLNQLIRVQGQVQTVFSFCSPKSGMHVSAATTSLSEVL